MYGGGGGGGGGDGDNAGEGSSGKPKRVRTGCLTCRERHLKCDEALPHCNNCQKSNRTCKRGVKLNFIDTWTKRPPRTVTLYGKPGWKIDFCDESRDIASEYVGGLAKYRHLEPGDAPAPVPPDSGYAIDYATQIPPPVSLPQQPLPPIQGILTEPTYPDPSQQSSIKHPYDPNLNKQEPDPGNYGVIPPKSGSSQGTHYGSSGASTSASWALGSDAAMDGESEKKEYLDTQEETLFMQVFIEEVGLWMDSMDSMKHFSRLLPFHALSEPMLLNAYLACGAKHLTLVNPTYTEAKALHYYDTATRYLLRNLQNPNRDTVICATTAVILNVYEVMSERALQRMNHIAGARALIKECGWSARAQGIGAACFWLNVGLEVLSCLHFNWQVAWDPDEWGLDMDLTREAQNGREEVWTHRMLYLVAKVCNFRATIPRYAEPDPREQQIRTQQRYERWCKLRTMTDAWNDGIPRTMQPMAYLYPYQTSSKSAFPEVWLVKRATIVARLFYHTAYLLLAQTNPYYGTDQPEMAELQRRHSQMICGIAAHVKDRGVASVAIRSLAHAAEVLTDRREQEEVLQIFEKINKETGWRIGFVYGELKDKWGWNEAPSPAQLAQTHEAAARQQKEAREAQDAALHSLQLQQGFSADFGPQGPSQNLPAPPPPPPPQGASKRPPAGIPNPLYAKADFTLPQHPYQNFYVAPSPNSGTASGFAASISSSSAPGSGHLYYSF